MQSHDCGRGIPYGICPACHQAHGYVILQTQPQTPTGMNNSIDILNKRKHAELELQIATERRHYWLNQAKLRTNPQAKADAAGIAAAWKTTVAARAAALADLTRQLTPA